MAGKDDKKTVYTVKMSDYTTPKMVDDSRENYVTWGAKNFFWGELNELYYNSPSNAACINGIVRLAYGDGLINADGSKPLQIFNRLSVDDLRKVALQFVKTNKISLQVDYNTDSGERTIKGVYYLHGQSVALGKRNEETKEIETIYYCNGDWGRKSKKTPYPAFGFGSANDKTEIFFYQKAFDTRAYYGPVDYQGGIPYANLEIETANYHINHSKNAFTSSAIINLNNGVPDKTTRDDIIADIVDTRTGSSNAGKVVVLFNQDSANGATVEPFDIPDAHKQYEFVAKESMEKIFVSHNITSPLLLGIRSDSAGGLGSNSEEIKEAYNLFNLMVLEPIRQNIIEALTEIFGADMLGVDFKQFDFYASDEASDSETATAQATLRGSVGGVSGVIDILKSVGLGEIEASAASSILQELYGFDEETANKIVGGEANINTRMSESPKKISDEDSKAWLAYLEDKGEVIDEEEWDILFTEPVGSMEDEIAFEEKLIGHTKKPKSPKPQEKSERDSGLYKIRYSYEGEESKDSRDFCSFMVGERKKGKVYRREDISIMSDSGVNGEFAPQGKSTYDIFLYKGGVYCHHHWERKVYFRKRNPNGSFKPASKTAKLENDKEVSISEARKAGVPAKALTTPGIRKAETPTIDMPNRGSLKNK